MDLDLQSLLGEATSRGRKPVQMHASVARTLTVEDLQELAAGGASVPVPTVKELQASHHKLAQVLASGARNAEASIVTGYSTGRIVQLKDDPQFQELLAYYKEIDQAAFTDLRTTVHERLSLLGLDTIDVTHRRLQDNPEAFSGKELVALAELALDRIGHGKTSTQQVEHSHRIDEEQLARLRAAADTPAQIPPQDRAALVSLALRATEGNTPAETVEGIEGSGGGLREEGGTGTSEAARTIIDLPSVG